jgi:hypothetical protein
VVASYTLVPAEGITDTAGVHAALMQAGFDAAIVLRLVGVESSTSDATRTTTPSWTWTWSAAHCLKVVVFTRA